MATSLSISRPPGKDFLFPVFSLTWAGATLIHQVSSSFWMEGSAGWLLVVAAFAVVFEPRCLLRFTAMIAVSLVNFYTKLPFVPNHILFEGMLHVTMTLALLQLVFLGKLGGPRTLAARLTPRALPLVIASILKTLFLLAPFIPKLPAIPAIPAIDAIPAIEVIDVIDAIMTLILAVALGRYVFMKRRIEGHGELFISDISSVLRIALVMLYVWAVVQKLNWDYLDPEVSCAVSMNAEIVSYFPSIPFSGWALHATIWGTFVLELAIAIFLLIPRTRSLGFFLAITFHLWLSIHRAFGIYSFSALAFATLVLFLPLSSVASLKELWQRQLTWLGRGDEERGRRISRWGVVLLCSCVMIGQGACYLVIERSPEVFWGANRIGFVLFSLWAAWLIICFLLALSRSRMDSRRVAYRARPTWAWLGLTLVLFNGICPWIGLKTQTSFSMYSNLRSEGPGNHLFLRRIDLFDYQNEMVELVSSEPDLLAIGPEPQGIQQFANPGRIFPFFELRRLVSETDGNLRLVYRRGEEEFRASRFDGEISGDRRLFKRHPLILSRLLWFRRHESLDGPMHCTH